MQTPEKFSPAQEFKKLDQERISSGMLAVYPELWGPIEKETREAILESATQEINTALREKNFARAGGLMRSLRNYFEEDTIRARMASKEYDARLPAESETASEVQELFKGVDWDKAKERLQRYSAHPTYYLALASEMRKFDPQRFDEEIQITDDQWQRFVNATEDERNNPTYFLRFASLLKELDPKRFERDIKIDNEYWDRIAKETEKERNYPRWFVYFYNMAHTIDAQKIQEQVSIDSDYWDKIKTEIKRLSDSLEYEAMLASAAQRIKPKGLPDLTVSREQWEKMKGVLQDMLKYGEPERVEFMYANELKSLEVDKLPKNT